MRETRVIQGAIGAKVHGNRKYNANACGGSSRRRTSQKCTTHIMAVESLQKALYLLRQMINEDVDGVLVVLVAPAVHDVLEQGAVLVDTDRTWLLW